MKQGQGIARRCLVSGRVQGVYYRASARDRARSVGVLGYARNLPDGRVEILACGSEGAVLSFIDWLWQGPSAARVEAVAVEALELAGADWPQDFKTG